MMSELSVKTEKNKEEDELDLINLVKKLWNNRNLILKSIIIFSAIGILIAVFSPKEYTATSKMVPQINNPNSKMGGLSSLASLAGFNLDMTMSSTDISPIIYPQIVNSISFQLKIMNSSYKFEDMDKEVTLYDYYVNNYKPGLIEIIKKYTIELPGILLKTIRKKESENDTVKSSNLIRISREQEDIRRIIEENLTLNVNDKEGLLTLSSTFHQPELSAMIAKRAQNLLQDYITDYKVEKAKVQYNFIEERYYETNQEFLAAQTKLAKFRDANQNVTSALAQTELERLEYEYQITYEVYSELAKQLEQARIKVKEETPVFAVIEEVSVPIEKSKPNRLMILIIWFVMGLSISIGWIYVKGFVQASKERWNHTSEF